MIIFFQGDDRFYAVECSSQLADPDLKKLSWLFGDAVCVAETFLPGTYIGPRREMITPWSTNAVEITQNMGICGISRIEEFINGTFFDPMLQHIYDGLDQDIFTITREPEPIQNIEDISAYSKQEGLALSSEEIKYLDQLSEKIGRKLTDSEVFGFSQVNSEHCRHKIFNGTFIIDGKEMTDSLFEMIKKTSRVHPGLLVSAYKDNVAFILGPAIEQFAPLRQDIADFFVIKDIQSVISLKAETHNFPTTVEPFNGAATGSGGEIRDRMAGGKGSIPLAGTAVYMTSYPRLEQGRSWEKAVPPRKWLYKTPEEILIKASNGASDFGNKFGQALICGSVLTFEHSEEGKIYGYDKVIMQAGGIGFGKKADSLKELPGSGEVIVVLGGDNYRIGMGGGAVSSVATGEYGNSIELNAVQRSNPEMQKRVFNAIRAMTEMDINPIVSIHDHGAGGHLNSLSELVENTGGTINIKALPVGDPTLSDREIISNESQERMGMVLHHEDVDLLHHVAERERAPMYVVGETTGDSRLIFEDTDAKTKPINLSLEEFFGKPPKTILTDNKLRTSFRPLKYSHQLTSSPAHQLTNSQLEQYLIAVLQLEAVACKDWLTNKVDRAVSGRIAKQQTCGSIQLPLNNLGVVAMDYRGKAGIATSLGHAPVPSLIDPLAGSRLAVAEALTNLVWAPLTHGLRGVSLSANWMWPCKNPGEDARLYEAVKAVSEFAMALGINIPTGKDSLSMTQKYPDGSAVISPGTVIISAVGEVSDVKQVVSPALTREPESELIFIPFANGGFELGGSSFAQSISQLGDSTPDVTDAEYFISVFETIQELVRDGAILAGHDISAGGLITTLLEMSFPVENPGMEINLDLLALTDTNPDGKSDIIRLLFSEKPGVVLQIQSSKFKIHNSIFKKIGAIPLGKITGERHLIITCQDMTLNFDIDALRDIWFRTSYLLDRRQSGEKLALERFNNYKHQPLKFRFSNSFTGKAAQYGIDLNRRKKTGISAAIIREKGVNRDRDMAWAMYMAGFDVKDVHMTDLISGRENLEDVSFIAFVGGFSNSDVLGSAKGWAGAFLYNEKAKQSLDRFYLREDTLSLGVCNGCQLMMELGLIVPDHKQHPRMTWNDSHKYECSFIGLDIMANHSVMLESLEGSKLGIWVAHGEGKFSFPEREEQYHIPARFSYSAYPGNPNGSMYDAACLASDDGRHLAMMPHLEDSVLPWQWPCYPDDRKEDEVTPWIEAFVNARAWIQERGRS